MTVTTQKSLISITDRAVEQMQLLIKKRNKPTLAIKLLLETKGCSGLKYKLQYADEVGPGDKVIEKNGVRLVIDPKALMFVIGTTMDFEQDDLKAGFTFINPKEKGRCGCGESFYV